MFAASCSSPRRIIANKEIVSHVGRINQTFLQEILIKPQGVTPMTVVHFAGKPLFAATLLFSTHLVGAIPRTGDSVLQSEQMYDDETMLEGLVFGTGPVAPLLPELATGALRLPIQERDKILRRISQEKPDFLRNFAAAMRSGDHVQIADHLDKARAVISASLLETKQMSTMSRIYPQEETCVFLNVVNLVNVIHVANVVGGVQLVWFVFVFI